MIFSRALILAVCLFLSCDTNRFVGYQYDAEPLQTFAQIEGKVLNIFDESETVSQARLSFEGQTTSSDFSGNYSINYVLPSDALRDRPISLRITQDRYFPLDTTLVIRGDVNDISWRMTYGAPRVKSSVKTIPVFTAVVFDYQGINSLSSVQAIVTYRDGVVERRNHDTPFLMTRTSQIDANTAVYEVSVPDSIVVNNGITANLMTEAPWSIQATDVDGFIETVKFSAR
ncbi:MAG: hypothetical protein ACRBF0_24705 [Calditrichia bacterium]